MNDETFIGYGRFKEKDNRRTVQINDYEKLVQYSERKGVRNEFLHIVQNDTAFNSEYVSPKSLIPSGYEQMIENMAALKKIAPSCTTILSKANLNYEDFQKLKELGDTARIRAVNSGIKNDWIETFLQNYLSHYSCLIKGHDDVARITNLFEEQLSKTIKEYDILKQLSLEFERKSGAKIYDEECLFYISASQGGDELGRKRVLGDLQSGSLALSPELIEHLKKDPKALNTFGYGTKDRILKYTADPTIVGRERRTSVVPRPTQARDGRPGRVMYMGSEYLGSSNASIIQDIYHYMKERKPELAENFMNFFRGLMHEEKKYERLAQETGTIEAGFSLNLIELNEFLAAKRNKKGIASTERADLIKYIENGYKAASWTARRALEVGEMKKTIESNDSENDILSSLEASVRFMNSSSQRGLVFDDPPLHGGNGGEDARDYSECNYKAMGNIFQKIDNQFINSVEYQIKRSPVEDIKITMYHFSSEPRENKTGDLGMAVKITNNINEKFLDIEQILMLKKELREETFATLALNGKMRKYTAC